MDKTANTSNKNNNIDHEQGAFERLRSDLKNTIFGVNFILLKGQEISIYSAFILYIIQFIQIIYFIFHDNIRTVWNEEDVTYRINQILGYFNIVPYFEETNWELYITFLYIGLAIVGFSVISAIYVSYSYSQKKLPFSWLIVILRDLITLFTTIFYLPFLQYFISILKCMNDGQGNNVHYAFTSIECWSGVYIIHAIFAIIGTILFICMGLVGSLTFFEYKSNPNDPTARVTSRPNFFVNVYQTIMIICLTFLTSEQWKIVFIVLILIGSTILFQKFYFMSYYHDEGVAKLWAILVTVNLWSAIMLVLAEICENYIFDGTVIVWIIGIPFVGFFVYIVRDPRIDLLLINVNKFQSGEELQNQIRFILKLIKWQSTNKNAAILLDGYMEIHKQSWKKDEDPQKQKGVKNNRFTKSLMNQDETLNEKYAVLIQMLYKMYFYGIKKFPSNTALRISYAFFLLEKMNTKQQALQELTQAEQNDPSLDEMFTILRYKKIIEDEIAESQTEGQGGLDVVSEVAFQTHLRQLQANIEKSALLHMEFWSQLSEDNPDLAKLSNIGSKISSSVQYVEDNWNKIQKINQNSPKAMRAYGKFLLEILNDKEGGEELLEKARNIANAQTNKRFTNITGKVGDEFNNEATPLISISGEQDNYGVITSCNLQAASIFGYNKTELINRKVNVLMPQVFSKYHDAFLENYLNSGESAIIGKNKQRLVFGKNKSNYILPLFLNIKAVQSIIQGTQFLASLRLEKNFKNTAYILTTSDGTIDAMSSSCINLLKIDIKSISHKKANIQDYIPDILKNRSNLFSSVNNAGRASAVITFTYPKDSEYLDEDDDTYITLNCHLNELVFLSGKEHAGLQFKFEYTSDKTSAAIQVADKKAKLSNFQFRYEKNKPNIVGEYVDGSFLDLQSTSPKEDVLTSLNKSTVENDPSAMDGGFKDTIEAWKSKQQEEEQVVKRIDYGVGIKTLRLFHGKPTEIETEQIDEGDEDVEEHATNSFFTKNSGQKAQDSQASQEDELMEEGSYKDFNTTFKSRKALSSVISDRTSFPIIRNFKWVINFLYLLLIIIAIIDYIIAHQEFNKIQKNIDLLNKSNRFLAEMMTSLSKVHDLYLLNINLYQGVYDENSLKSDLKDALDAAKDLKENLERETDSLSSAHLYLLNQPVVNLITINQTVNSRGLIGAIEDLISKGYSLQTSSLSTFNLTNADYYYVTYNLLNSFYLACKSSSEFYAMELISKVDNKNTSFLLLLLGSVATLIVALIILAPILYQVNKGNEEVLSLFLDIPEKTVKGLYNKCEAFISNLQVGEEDDVISETEEDELDKNRDDDNLEEFIPKRKKKRFKNSNRSPTSFFVSFLLLTMVVEAYFLYNFFTSSNLLDNINVRVIELNATSVSEPYYSFANNAERQLFIDSTYDILLESDPLSVVTSNIKSMYNLDSLILQEHSINRKIHSNSYNDIFSQIMMGDPCPSLTTWINSTACGTFSDYTVSQGITVGLTKNFENLRVLLTCYSALEQSQSCSITVPNNATLNGSFTSPQTQILHLMLTSQSQDISFMQDIYIKNSFRILINEFQNSVNHEFDSAMTRRLIIFIVFIIIIIVMYVVAWLPLMGKISNDIWKTKAMLTMIPLNVIAKIRTIRLYVKRYWNERNIME